MNVCDQENIKLFLSDLNESSHYTFNIQSGKPDRSSESIPSKVCCGNRISATDFRNWYSFYCHALQFPQHWMRMKFPCHCVGISFPHHYMGMKFPQNGLGMKFPQTICWNCILFIILSLFMRFNCILIHLSNCSSLTSFVFLLVPPPIFSCFFVTPSKNNWHN